MLEVLSFVFKQFFSFFIHKTSFYRNRRELNRAWSFGSCRLCFASAWVQEEKAGNPSLNERPPVSAEFYGGDWESAEVSVNSPQAATTIFEC